MITGPFGDGVPAAALVARGWPVTVAGQPVKLVCSCVRDPSPLLDGAVELAAVDASPRDGDLVLVRCLDSAGAYDHVEDSTGAAVRLYRGDVFVATLGTRRSGTNPSGAVPAFPIARGHRLSLVAQGGLVAECLAVPSYYGTTALPVEVVGFPARCDGTVLNLEDSPLIEVGTGRAETGSASTVFVCGTSAEVGKTMTVCNLGVAAKAVDPSLRTAAIKACGTGRAKDVLQYRAANYDLVTDFVDAGMPSTYGVGVERFTAMLHTLVAYCRERVDLVVVELGGDFLEARAPEALELLAALPASCVLLVNDAMGAADGMRRLEVLDCRPRLVGTLRQNPHALAERLGLPAGRVMDPRDPAACTPLVEEVLRAGRSPGRRVGVGR